MESNPDFFGAPRTMFLPPPHRHRVFSVANFNRADGVVLHSIMHWLWLRCIC
jgi:hypothetical protein